MRLKSRMEELQNFRDTMTVAKMPLVIGASPGTDRDEPNKQGISNQLSMPTFGAPMLGGPIESTKFVSYFESRDNAMTTIRTGLQTPPTIGDTSYNADQDIPTLGSWDLGEAYPVALSLNGIGLANGEHASPQFCLRPLEEVNIAPRPLFLHQQALKFVFSSQAASPHPTYLKMARLHCILQPRAAGCPLCSSSYDYNLMCLPKTQWAVPACTSPWGINSKASWKNWSSVLRVSTCRRKMGGQRYTLRWLKVMRVSSRVC